MNRYEKLFKKLKKNNEGAFVPFTVLGDPTPNFSMRIIDTLIKSGADALELGIPFSDPIGDGPIIQKAVKRSLAAGTTLKICLEILKNIRKKHPEISIGLLTYTNLIFQNKINNFYAHCASIDIDSVLIVDLPIEESSPFRKAATKNKISQIFICPPNATNHLLEKIIMYSQAYIYLLSRSGVTGTKFSFSNSLNEIIKKLKTLSNIPIMQGFGIYKTNQISKILSKGISGIISGSAIVQIIEKNINYPEILLDKLSKFIHTMKATTYKI